MDLLEHVKYLLVTIKGKHLLRRMKVWDILVSMDDVQ